MEKSTEKNCIYIKKCGGCTYSHSDYQKSLRLKEEKVRNQIGAYANKIMPIIGMDNPYHYRNKVHAVLAGRKSKIYGGIYKEGTHEVVDVNNECMIEDERADKIIASVTRLLSSFKYTVYDEDLRRGLFRHILIRTAHKTGQIMLVLVASSKIIPSKNNLVKAIIKENPAIDTIILNLNDKKTNLILGQYNETLYGKGYIEDELCGKRFRISPNSFYQINSVQTETLYGKAVEYAALTGNETVIDAYCGIGTIGICASDKCKRVIGVETNKDAIKDAGINKKINALTNAEYINADAGEYMVKFAALNKEKVDVVFMDPPRAGSDKKFMDSVAKLNPKMVVYISCNPKTMADDLKVFKKLGYNCMEATPVDMFPFTDSCEVVAYLKK